MGLQTLESIYYFSEGFKDLSGDIGWPKLLFIWFFMCFTPEARSYRSFFLSEYLQSLSLLGVVVRNILCLVSGVNIPEMILNYVLV